MRMTYIMTKCRRAMRSCQTTVAISTLALPFRHTCCHFDTSVAISTVALPFQHQCCHLDTSVAISTLALPFRHLCCNFNTHLVLHSLSERECERESARESARERARESGREKERQREHARAHKRERLSEQERERAHNRAREREQERESKREIGIDDEWDMLWLPGEGPREVSFAESSLFYRALLQKRPIIALDMQRWEMVYYDYLEEGHENLPANREYIMNIVSFIGLFGKRDHDFSRYTKMRNGILWLPGGGPRELASQTLPFRHACSAASPLINILKSQL